MTAKPFLQSDFWEKCSGIYHDKQEMAWDGVPYYYTCNPKVAEFIAQSIEQLGALYPNQTLQIVDLGCGSGIFSHYLYRVLNERNVDFRLLLADLVPENIEFLKNHPQWKDKNVAFQAYDILKAKEQRLNISEGPVFIIMNYLLDSLPFDALKIKNNKIYQCEIDTSRTKTPFLLKDVKFSSKVTDFKSLHPTTRSMLSHYQGFEGYLSFPVIFQEWISALSKQHHDVVCFIHDKGTIDPTNNRFNEKLSFVQDGALHTKVNFHAIKNWCMDLGGVFCHDESDRYGNLCFMSLAENQSLGQLMRALLTGVSWRDIHLLHIRLSQKKKLTFSEIEVLLHYSNFSDFVYANVHAPLMNLIVEQPDYLSGAKKILEKVYDQYYWHPTKFTSFFILIEGLCKLQLQQKALELLNGYGHYFDNQYLIHLSYGRVYYLLQEGDRAKKYFDKALRIKPNCEESQRFIDLLSD
tara:strand:+ start:1848 stop:3242 length:1395 start_codon:yes stop_codon:yes gene_type:complete